jgi:hypothetical protein
MKQIEVQFHLAELIAEFRSGTRSLPMRVLQQIWKFSVIVGLSPQFSLSSPDRFIVFTNSTCGREQKTKQIEWHLHLVGLA